MYKVKIYSFVTTIIGIISICICFFLRRRNSNRDANAEGSNSFKKTSRQSQETAPNINTLVSHQIETQAVNTVQSNIKQGNTHLNGTKRTEYCQTKVHESSGGTNINQSRSLKSERSAESSKSLARQEQTNENGSEILKQVSRGNPITQVSTTKIDRSSQYSREEENKSSTQQCLIRTDPNKLSRRNADKCKSSLLSEKSIKGNESSKSTRNTDHKNMLFVKDSSNISASSHPKTNSKINTSSKKSLHIADLKNTPTSDCLGTSKTIKPVNSRSTSYETKKGISASRILKTVEQYKTAALRSPQNSERKTLQLCYSLGNSEQPISEYQRKTHPQIDISHQKPKRRFSLRQFQYIHKNISLNDVAKSEIKEYYTNCVNVDIASRDETWTYCDKIVRELLKRVSKYGIVTSEPDIEGSLASGVKTGKADECDFSVEIRLLQTKGIELSYDPFVFVFEDDIDSSCGKSSGKFASDGKRFFNNVEEREHFCESYLELIRTGYVAVCLGDRDAKNFSNYCTSHPDNNKSNWVVPFLLLSSFYTDMKHCINKYQGLQNEDGKIQLNEAVKGPAVTLTIMHEGVHNISVDITPKITLPSQILSLYDFLWPRRQTKYWLDESVIENILQQQIYLVPKGDKYWKISFANCENALLADIDTTGTWRKGCLRLMKKKLSLWRSKSTTGLKGISSYHLKTTLLWLCENLPDDDFWNEDQLANRYLTFLKELNYRLKIGRLGEYFNPDVNLLDGKDTEEIEEVQNFIVDEISMLQSKGSSVSQFEEYF